MSNLMGDQFCAIEFFLLCGILLKEDAAVAELDSTRMLHAAKLVVRQNDHTIFFERTSDRRIAFHPFQSLACLIEYLVELGDFSRVGLTIECSHQPSVTRAGLLLKVSSYE